MPTEWGNITHVCGLQGFNPLIDPPCPACEARSETLRLFQVRVDKKKKNGRTKRKVKYFTLKSQAKEVRDSLIKDGQKDAHVELGPDHDRYNPNKPQMRPSIGWNRGRHPKKGKKKESYWHG